MDQKSFKKIINDTLIINNFSKKGKYYYYESNDIGFIIGLQKSNFANGYYINIGFFIKKLNPAFKNLRDVDGDIRARFSFDDKGKRLDFFDLDSFKETSKNEICAYIQENVSMYVSSTLSLPKLKILLEERPVMLYQTKLSVKELLGLQ